MNDQSHALQARDYKSDIKPIWCPGCGHYAVLSALTKALAHLRTGAGAGGIDLRHRLFLAPARLSQHLWLPWGAWQALAGGHRPEGRTAGADGGGGRR